MADAPKTIPMEDLFPDGTSVDGQPRQRRTRQPSGTVRVPGVSKETFKEAFELASSGLKLAGAGSFAFTPEEIDKMADAWYRIAKEYPSFGKQVVKGNRLTIWGNLILVNTIVVGKRVDMGIEWWQHRPQKPKPAQRPTPVRPTPTVQQRPTGQQPVTPEEEPAQWGPSSVEGAAEPTGT